ncbi:recombinase family protein [Caulobacter sp. S45]|uniref:recombinase family protein n=1 Tax=Caulobacter sp. S45 TaxID=1641861 RepID=UPI00131CDD33|nr:recombinase family protein [Caulobacter sp. S45]
MTAPVPRRCAIYTRKSTEEGLEQAFNTLHAQREACEAYVASQKSEGWQALPTAYDDGGFSGGNLERPAMQRLVADVELGLIDVVVVYKVDRLTRSLSDFARIVEIFDRKGASFVSVTQAFNTTTSMGRLTLNVLLSFAQFEREVTGERIRDKIAASKAKGLWMGGILPLGYEVKDKRLVVIETEAQVVRLIFNRYAELGSVNPLLDELRAVGLRSKAWVTRAGRTMGGLPFNSGSLYHLLSNAHYVGSIKHKDLLYPGQHPPIVSVELFENVQRQLRLNQRRRADVVASVVRAPLKRLVFTGGDRPLTPSFGRNRHGKAYRYYVDAAQSDDDDPSAPPRRVPAEPFERFMVQQLSRFTLEPSLTTDDLPQMLRRIDLREASVELVVCKEALRPDLHPDLLGDELRGRLGDGERIVNEPDRTTLRISLPVRMQFRGGRTWIRGAAPQIATTAPRAANRGLVRALRQAHAVVSALGGSPLKGQMQIKAAPASTYLVRLAQLAFLAPDIQLDILGGRHSPSLTTKMLLEADVPLEWTAQRKWFRAL